MTAALLWVAVDLDTEAKAIHAASADPAVTRKARACARARAEAFREAAARIRTALKGDSQS